MTPQEIFTRSVTHMRQQGERAKHPDTEKCFYLAPDGKQCAVGCLIEDAHLAKDMDESPLGQAIETIIQNPYFKGRLPGWMYENEALLGELQYIHDNFLEPSKMRSFEAAISETAETHGLEVPA